MDNETGLYNYRNRYYSSDLGRFLQTDPLNYYDSMNLYKYCFNDPINYLDPYGLWSFTGEFYPGVGGGIVVGTNPDGTWFIGGRIGVGVGGGVSYDPNGKAPGASDSKCGKKENKMNLDAGFFADAGIGLSPLPVSTGLSGNTGTHFSWYPGTSTSYTNPIKPYGLGSKDIGKAKGKVKMKDRIGASAGGEIYIYYR